jgi:putative peptidoglycan lipid II flippase
MRSQIARSAGIIALGNLSSRILGLVRDQLIAILFGRSLGTDAFFVASSVTTTFYDLLVGGAISSAMVPIFSEHAGPAPLSRESPLTESGQRQRRRLWRSASLVLNLVLVVVCTVVITLELLAPWVVRAAGGGWDQEALNLATGLARLAFPALIGLGVSAVLTALLYALQDFTFPAFTAAAFNASMIMTAFLFHGHLGVTSLALGMLVGAGIQVLLQLPPLVRQGASYTAALSLRDVDVQRVIVLYAPVAAGLVISLLQVFLDRNLATRTGEGGVSAMTYATRLIQFPLGLVPTAIGGASLPILARQADLPAFRTTLETAIRLTLILILPAAVLLGVLAWPIIALLFQHGAFTTDDTGATALALLLYLPGLPAAAIDQILVLSFYARRNTIVPVAVGVLAMGFYLVVALPLLGPLSFYGLVIANSAQWLGHMTAMTVLTWRSVPGLAWNRIVTTLGKALLACSILALTALGVTTLMQGVPLAWITLHHLIVVVMAGIMGVAAYLGAALALGMEDIRTLLQRGVAWTLAQRP